jgi:peroxiredoxin
MRNSLSTCLLVLLFAALGAMPRVHAQTPGEPVDPWSLISGEGTEIDFPRIAEGKPALLFFVPAGCSACTALASGLEALRADFVASELEVYVISPQDPAGDAGFGTDSDLVLLIDDASVAAGYGLEGVPALLLIDRRGRLDRIESDAGSMDQWLAGMRLALQQLVSPE